MKTFYCYDKEQDLSLIKESNDEKPRVETG